MNGSSIVSMIDVYKSEWFFPALFALSASTEVFSTTMRMLNPVIQRPCRLSPGESQWQSQSK